MKKKRFYQALAIGVTASALLASCESKKSSDSDQQADNTTELQSLMEEGVKESFTPGEKEGALDSLQEVEELVNAVETPQATTAAEVKYDAAFFTNPKNKSAKPVAGKYVETPSGLRYTILKEGKGKHPVSTDQVTVHYTGTLTDGTQFDSSVDRGEPTTFPLNRVIPGWTEGLQLMGEGGEAIFYIPGNLAYGETGIFNYQTQQYLIPPNAPLIFWVSLLTVN